VSIKSRKKAANSLLASSIQENKLKNSRLGKLPLDQNNQASFLEFWHCVVGSPGHRQRKQELELFHKQWLGMVALQWKHWRARQL